ncbi:hypothetical protein GOP47_0015654 [Adiantum capillus-veneris]|uniref:DNA polymerase alpha subunit B n=1 Tax=Adiantum capillus-veneris TaxID=13818 RepID=A0A9D4ZBE8_ADICA|nr:hypothetical protein GOP47_0015654 [Adiantum capillus-veneris]
MEQELVDEFAANSFVLEDQEVTKQCTSLCASFALKPAELVSYWELFYLNSRLEGGRVLGSQLDYFRQFIQKEQREAFRRKQTDFHFYSQDDVDMLLASETGEDEDNQFPPAKTPTKTLQDMSKSFVTQMDIDDGSMGPKTPGSVNMPSLKSKSRLENGSPATPFSQRSTKLKVQFVLNKDLPDMITDEPTEMASEDDVVRRLRPVEYTNLQVSNVGLKLGTRFMFDRTEEKFNVLEKRIKNYAEILADREGLAVDNQVSVASQERTFVVGMVCCDGEGHLNDKSVLLQGSVEYSSGHRVRLDLNMLERFSLFPGQVIGVDGHNPSGHCLVASRIVDSIPMSVKDDLLESQAPQAKRQVLDDSGPLAVPKASKALSMVIAAGPFTTSDNLAYEPLVELLDFARKKQPNLLVLMGPFVDSEHPQVKQGAVDRTFQEIFVEEVGSRIEEYCEEMGSGARVVLVPSVRDCHHDFVFPQSPFVVPGLKDPEHQITLLGNPGVFSLNELAIGCCTVDVLRHLSSEEASWVPAGTSSDRLGRIASHIIGQRSFYPLYPAPAGVPLDLSRSPEALQLPQQLDVLVTPSDLSPFVKTLSQPVRESQAGLTTLCINPGRLAKGMYGGTFTEMLANPMLNDRKEQWPNNAKVSIIRL